MLASILKCITSFNHHGKRYKIINKRMTRYKCPRCLQTEDWDYVIIYPMIREGMKEFIIRLYTELLKVKPEAINIKEILNMLSNIITYFVGGS